jgi:segregation and condensation protein A
VTVVPCTVTLPIFEGPLDLLLHLIKRNEVSVTDIPIATITDQYLAVLEERPELNLDGAGEYLVMAATLTFIKSRMLLPVADDDEPEEDPRAELVQQLAEYERYREVAVALGERPVLARDVFAAPGEAAGERPALPVRDASVGDLLAALREVLRRVRPARAHEVAREELSIRDAVGHILDRFSHAAEVEFSTLFPAGAYVGAVIVTFLALLELIRLGIVRAWQTERFAAIRLALAVGTVEEAVRCARDLGEAFEGRRPGAPAVRGGEEERDEHGTLADR